jgi:2-polyprenyl-3-methyl-5-hydroxy-6-metoxy-1,4-benzoquinol methylase
MEQKTIKEYIRALEHMTGFLRSLLEEELKTPKIPEDEREMLSEITNLRILAKSEKWPLAIPAELICGDDEDQKLSRAAGIVNDFIGVDMKDKTFLDFGCGEGHTPYVAANLVGVKSALGYDIKNQKWEHFNETKNLEFTTEFEKVQKSGPFDIILINDVLDHCKDPIEILKQIKSIKSPTGIIYARCHPWTSRHGSHLYRQLNRAYLHLVFNENELYSMGLNPQNTSQIIDPIKTYHKIIGDAGLNIVNEDVITQPVELFFTHEPSILRRIKSQWSISDDPGLASGKTFPRDILEVQFVDYILF